jgi:hypothetical protein
MNNIFNIKRFGFAFRKDVMENWKRFALMFLTMLGVMAIVLTFQSLNYYDVVDIHGKNYENLNKNLLGALLVMFAAFGLLFASTFMNPMNSKTKRIAWLTCPASALEKYLTRWLIVTVGYAVAFFIALWMVDAMRVGICSARYPKLTVDFLDLSKLVCPGDGFTSQEGCVFANRYTFGIVLNVYFLIQSLFILGSTFWEKATFIKTFTAVAVVVLAYILVCRQAILLFYGGEFDGFGNVLASFEGVFNNDRVKALTFATCVQSAFTLTNWVLAFFRIRESEIIKRL